MQLQVETKLYKDNAIDNALDKAAREYITYVDESVGIQVHDKATVGTQYDDYVQINSDDISMWRDRTKMMSLDDDALKFYYNGDTANPIARYGEAINLYKIGTQVPVVTINQDGATFEGTINATDGNLSNSVTIGGKDQSEYLNSNVQIGNLLRLTPKLYEKNEYLAYQLNLTENLISGETYTIQFWGMSLDDNSEGIELFWGGHVIPLTLEPLYPDENGYLSYTFKATLVTSNNAWINVYNVPEEEHNNKNISIVRWKLEKGSIAKAWALAVEDMESTYSCVCNTATATAEKVAACDNFILNVGTVVAVKFVNGNNCTSAMTLNVGETGFKKVLLVGEIEASSSEVYRYNLSNNTTVTFVYDGENWRITGDNQLPAQITHIDSGGISIHPVGDINQKLNITSSGIDLYKDGNSVASYGQTTRIGRDEDKYYHTTIDANGMSIWSGKEATDATGTKKLALFSGNSIIFYKPGTNTPVTTLDTNGLKIYKDGNLKGDFNSTITLYGGNATGGAYPKVEISNSAITIARFEAYKTIIDSSGMQIYTGDTENSIASFGLISRIGKENSGHINISSYGLYVYTNSTNKVADFDSLGIYLYYNDTNHQIKTIIGSSGITMYNNDSNHTTLATIGSSGMRLYYNNSTNWKARVDENGLFLYNNVSASAKNYYKAYINSNGATFYNDSGTSSISMNVGSGDIRLTRDDVSLGSIGFNKDTNDNNLYGIELHLDRSTNTLHPGWVGITATDSAGANKYKLIYLQDNASIGSYTSGAINVDCDLDMNWSTIRDAYLASTTLKVIPFQCLTGGYIAAGSYFYSGALSSGYSGTERMKGLVGYDLSGAGSGYCSVNTCKINPSDGTYEIKIVNHSTTNDATSVNLTIYFLVS